MIKIDLYLKGTSTSGRLVEEPRGTVMNRECVESTTTLPPRRPIESTSVVVSSMVFVYRLVRQSSCFIAARGLWQLSTRSYETVSNFLLHVPILSLETPFLNRAIRCNWNSTAHITASHCCFPVFLVNHLKLEHKCKAS